MTESNDINKPISVDAVSDRKNSHVSDHKVEKEISKPMQKEKKKFWKLTRRKQLELERLRSGIHWNFYIWIFTLLIMSTLLFISIIPIFENVENETQFITKLVPIIMLFQLLIIYVQLINQYRSNKISKIGFLPKLSVYSKINSFQGRLIDNQMIIEITNSGTDAHNVSYAIIIDKGITKSDVPLFLLREKTETEIYRISKDDFRKKQIDVRICFEDMVKTRYSAFFRKEANEESFRTLSTGLY